MTPSTHPICNDVLRRPEGVSEDDCADLDVYRTLDPAGREVVCSFWQPSEEERAAIARGEPVILQAWGRTHPPLALGVAGVQYE